MLAIRKENASDQDDIREINIAAFGTSAEADLIERLRNGGTTFISLVAILEYKAVGHILFTEVTSEDHPELRLVGLAPMAVHPSWQGNGVGHRLVDAGLEEYRSAGFGGIVVLGHPEYYSRFGFKAASRFGLKSEYEVPDEVFMALEIEEGYLSEVSGLIRCDRHFQDV